MPQFKWLGIDRFGHVCKGSQEAVSQEALKKELLLQGIAVYNITESWWRYASLIFSHFINYHKQLNIFFYHLSVLLESGVPLLVALSIVKKRVTTRRFAVVITSITQQVEQGVLFSQALAQYPMIFSPLIIHLVGIGEKTGKLAELLRMIASHFEQRQAIKTQIQRAIFMPVLTLLCALGIVMAIFTFVVPQLEAVVANVGGTLSPEVERLFKISAFLRSDGLFVVVGGALLFFLMIRIVVRHEKVKRIKDAFILHLWGIRSLVIHTQVVRYLKAISMMVKAGVSLGQALHYAARVVDNQVIQHHFSAIPEELHKGASLSQAFKKYHEFFPEEFLAVIAISEYAGDFATLLDKIADQFFEQLQQRLRFLVAILQPLLMISLGIIIAYLMVTIYMPIIGMIGAW